jgi:glycosyltransferase involved in cell wall biosynthesis
MVNTLGCFAGTDAALRAGLPVAWVIHESFSLADFSFLNWGFEGLSPLVRQRWEQSLADASALLFVADATRELFMPYSQPRRCLTTRYGIDLAQAEHAATEPTSTELRKQLGVPADARVLLTVGVSEPRKGHGQLLVAFERIHRLHPDAHLIIVGTHDSPYCDALGERVRDRGLSGSVSLIPLVRDPQAYFRIADLFVNSSDIESLPRSILEAIAFRIPVLAADVFGAREVITDGESGWLFSPNDLNALTVGLLRALETPADGRLRMAERARKHVDWFLDSSHYGEEYATILGRLADPDGPLEGQSA